MITKDTTQTLTDILNTIRRTVQDALVDTSSDHQAEKAANALHALFIGWETAVQALYPNMSIEASVGKLDFTASEMGRDTVGIYGDTKTLLARLMYIHGPTVGKR